MTTTKTKRQQIKMIKDAWNAIDYALSMVSWGQYGKQYLAQNIQEEKDHLRFKPEGVTHGLTALEGAKLFCVKNIAEYLLGHEAPKPEWFLHYRKGCYMAYAIAHKYGDKLREALKDFDLKELSDLDYAELAK